MNYTIPSGRQNQFVGNPSTIGTFPGFAMNNVYKVYIRYVNASSVQLNAPGGTAEMSTVTTPMRQADAPPNVRGCAPADRTAPCNAFVSVAFSAKVRWDRPANAGYGTYYPPLSYGIDYYTVELSTEPQFAQVAQSVTCRLGQLHPACNANKRVTIFQNLTAATYYFRVRTGTVIGDGLNSSTASIGLCDVPDASSSPAYFLNYSSACAAGYDYLADYAACPGGKYSTTSSETCLECWFGEFSLQVVGRCSRCPQGTYNQDFTAATSCTSCSLGSYSAATGATSRNTCQDCYQGKYSVSTGLSACALCPLARTSSVHRPRPSPRARGVRRARTRQSQAPRLWPRAPRVRLARTPASQPRRATRVLRRRTPRPQVPRSWQRANVSKMVVCSCDLDLELLCEGNLKLTRCATKVDSTGQPGVVTPAVTRSGDDENGGGVSEVLSPGTAPVDLHSRELSLIQHLHVIPEDQSRRHCEIVVLSTDRWHTKLEYMSGYTNRA
jgi:hypothetical protein